MTGSGHLKIFFGYAAGGGKTYAMLEAAHTAKAQGQDVVVGYVDTHGWPCTEKLLKGMEQLPVRCSQKDGQLRREFDLDLALERKPQLLILDDLAHRNEGGCRHNQRYQDIKELLWAGIDVYTTLNVQQIESLHDLVLPITGSRISEWIPDAVFDEADQVELVDVEPQELQQRFHETGRCLGFSLGKLAVLRELALRRCADRVNLLVRETGEETGTGCFTDEHILVCLSPAPSNARIIRTAARMAQAFRGSFTALFVESADKPCMEEEDRRRLQTNIRLAEQLGAKIETVCGEDISYQIAEFARLNRVSKIVIGRSTATRRHMFGKPALTEQLIADAPNLDIHIIPDYSIPETFRKRQKRRPFHFRIRDLLICTGALLAATILAFLFQKLGFTDANIITIYILSVLLVSVAASSQLYNLISSLASVIIFNFFFTEPRYTLRAYDQGYPVTFLVMFVAALITGTLASRLKDHARQSARTAYRTKILFDTNQLLGKAEGEEEIIRVTARQLIKLLGRDVVVYPAEQKELKEALVFSADAGDGGEDSARMRELIGREREVAEWVLQNNRHAGATTDTLSGARCLYLAIRVRDNVYGVVGIAVQEEPMDLSENGILLSILGECALALENERNAREKEEAAILARNEQLRANLLRSISHDLRTPLTTISGNASNLLSNGDSFDEATKRQLYEDIYEDSMWLISLVENLLAVTRIEEGKMQLRLSAELVDEVVAEALSHVRQGNRKHSISVRSGEGILMARIDARLIVQVVINLVDNALKYTPEDSHIEVSMEKAGAWITVSVSDDGPGIAPEDKKHVFDMFYSGAGTLADSRRSLGLGLFLCKSIVTAHGGDIWVTDRQPRGTCFGFTLPAEEVTLHE